jgi:hypothetical protein
MIWYRCLGSYEPKTKAKGLQIPQPIVQTAVSADNPSHCLKVFAQRGPQLVRVQCLNGRRVSLGARCNCMYLTTFRLPLNPDWATAAPENQVAFLTYKIASRILPSLSHNFRRLASFPGTEPALHSAYRAKDLEGHQPRKAQSQHPVGTHSLTSAASHLYHDLRPRALIPQDHFRRPIF